MNLCNIPEGELLQFSSLYEKLPRQANLDVLLEHEKQLCCANETRELRKLAGLGSDLIVGPPKLENKKLERENQF